MYIAYRALPPLLLGGIHHVLIQDLPDRHHLPPVLVNAKPTSFDGDSLDCLIEDGGNVVKVDSFAVLHHQEEGGFCYAHCQEKRTHKLKNTYNVMEL